MFKEIFKNVRKMSPIIHCITNYVTANDCANILLACGGSAIMADDVREVEEVTSLCDGLCINMGTLSERNINSMFLAGKKANSLEHPVLLDPVGVGSSKLRFETAEKLLSEINFTVIRGNISEIKTLAYGKGFTKGVDADISDCITENNVYKTVEFIKNFSVKTGAVTVVTGELDLVANSEKCFVIHNGKPEMRLITGTGCQLSAMITAFVTANPKNIFKATATAVCSMGLSGEIAYSHLAEYEGNATYRNRIIDTVNLMNENILEKGAKYEII